MMSAVFDPLFNVFYDDGCWLEQCWIPSCAVCGPQLHCGRTPLSPVQSLTF